MTTKVQLVSNIVGNVSGGASFTGIVTASSFSGSATGLSGTPNISITNLNVSGVSTLGSVSSLNVTGIVTATSFSGDGAGLTGLNIPATSDWRDASLF